MITGQKYLLFSAVLFLALVTAPAASASVSSDANGRYGGRYVLGVVETMAGNSFVMKVVGRERGFTVDASSSAIINNGGNKISFGNINTGDIIRVSGYKKGGSIKASLVKDKFLDWYPMY